MKACVELILKSGLVRHFTVNFTAPLDEKEKEQFLDVINGENPFSDGDDLKKSRLSLGENSFAILVYDDISFAKVTFQD